MDLDALDAIFLGNESTRDKGEAESVWQPAAALGEDPGPTAGGGPADVDSTDVRGRAQCHSEHAALLEQKDDTITTGDEAEASCFPALPDPWMVGGGSERFHGFARAELLTLAHPDERSAMEANADVLEAFAFALRLAEIRARGERPAHYTRPAHCTFCGPVWLFPGEAKQVLGCPWCENTANGHPLPRPPVSCSDCCHWRTDAVNPSGALGSCLVEAPASKRPGSLWPRGEIYCAVWRPTTEGELR
jgi:hypothetical protein